MYLKRGWGRIAGHRIIGLRNNVAKGSGRFHESIRQDSYYSVWNHLRVISPSQVSPKRVKTSAITDGREGAPPVGKRGRWSASDDHSLAQLSLWQGETVGLEVYMVRNAQPSSVSSCTLRIDLIRRRGLQPLTLLTRGSVVGRRWGSSASVSSCDSCVEVEPASDPEFDSRSDSLSTCEQWTSYSI